MKKILLFLLSIIFVFNHWAQKRSDFNSLCVFNDSIGAECFICSSVDSITFVNQNDSIYQSLWLGERSMLINTNNIDSLLFYNPYSENILEISQQIDYWDNAYVTPIGYFCYKSSLPYERDSVDYDLYEMLSYVDFEKTHLANIVMSKEYRLPVCMMVDSLSVYFTYSQDSICSMEIGCDSTIMATLDFKYTKSIVCDDNKYSAHNLKRNLWILVSLLEKNINDYEEISLIIEKFKALLVKDEEDVDKVDNLPMLNKNYLFCNQGYSPNYIVKEIYYTVVVMTGKAYNINATSAQLEGAVRCAKSNYNKYGTYGIICDENPDSLTIKSARFNFTGHQGRLSLNFKVNASGFDINTQYYYRAYFKITKKSDLRYRYGKDIAANATYGKIKSFRTLSPSAITEDVTDVTDVSVNLTCSFENVTGEMECGVLLYNDNNEITTTTSSVNGQREFTITGLKPATTYNYYAYVKFGEKIITGEVKSFTTELPDISGTWTCRETHYDRLGNETYQTYSITLNKDGTVLYSESNNVLSSSWFFSNKGKVTIAIMDIATNTANSGKNWQGQVDDICNPTEIKGSTYRWNSNHIGSFNGDPYEFVLTR